MCQRAGYLWKGAEGDAVVLGTGCLIQREEFRNSLGKIIPVNLKADIIGSCHICDLKHSDRSTVGNE